MNRVPKTMEEIEAEMRARIKASEETMPRTKKERLRDRKISRAGGNYRIKITTLRVEVPGEAEVFEEIFDEVFKELKGEDHEG